MGKPTGFLEYMREIPVDRSPLDRLKDWSEFHLHMDEKKLRNQGARCMDCGVPFCHTGRLVSGMAAGCPIHNLIPEFNDLVFRGLWQQAYERLAKTNNFPEFTGRVCPAPCEGSCVLGIHNPPVAIKNNEYSIIERAFEEGWVLPRAPRARTGKTIAVIGSGPSGLAAAAQLNTAGHTVTVYERADRPGGLLMYGIPNMKLDKRDVVLRRVELMKQEGITFICNASIGGNGPADIDPREILDKHDALILCTGATHPRDLAIEGRQFAGAHFALEFLTSSTKALLDQAQPAITAAGKHVVVIGGGDTGTDCVGTSLRQGCRSVTQIEIMPKPPLERQPNNPWPEWPKILKTDYGQEEAIARQGTDPRLFLTTVKKFIGDKNGRLEKLVTVQIKWDKNDKGQFVPVEQPGTGKELPAQLALIAMGFLGPEQQLLKELGLETDARGNIKAEHEKHRTNHPKIFAAGDCRRGQSLVVWAINEGRAAARECDRFLMGATQLA